MARTREFQSLPVYGAVEVDKVGAIRAILYQLEQGYFFDAARLWDVMRRDDRIAGCLTTRWNALLRTPLQWQPGKDTAKGRKIAAAAEELWPQMVSAGALAQLADWGNAVGIGVGELVWSKDWTPRLKVWHPQFLFWDWSSRRFRLLVNGYEDGSAINDTWVELPRTDRDVYSDGQWVIYCPGGFNEAWLRGMLRPLAEPYLIRRWTYRDAARYSEVYGIPMRGVVVPSAASEKDKDRFVRSVGRLGNESVIELPQVDSGVGFDLKLIETTGNGAIFDLLMAKVEASIGNTILGQSVAGEKPASIGSGQQNQDEQVRDDIRRADCRVYETLRDQVLRWWTVYQFGDAALTPLPVPQLDPPEDQQKKAQVLVALAQALPTLKGFGADVAQVLEDTGVPLLPEGERQVAPPPVEDAPQEPAEPEQLSAVEPGADPEPASRTYADRLSANAQAEAQEFTADWVARVMDAVNKSKTFDEVKARLTKLYAKASPRQMADLVEKAAIMAELAGRYETIKGL